MVEDQHFCNESAEPHRQTVTSYALNVVAVSLSLLITCGNLLVIISVIYFKQLHTPTNYLILSLAVTDLLVGALVLPFSTILSLSSCYYSSDFLCKVRGLFDLLLCASSILNLCFISVDRYYAVRHPLMYRNKMNVRVSVTMILVSWVLPILLLIAVIVRGIGKESPRSKCKIFLATEESTTGSVFAFYIPAVIILTIYLKILVVAKKQARRIQNIMKSEAALSKMENKANITLAIVMGVFHMYFAKDFLLQTDASEKDLGAVLLQGPPEDQHPVAYISRKLLPRERRYATVEKEALAIKWALDSFKYYLLGREFTLQTDHRALQWLEKMKDTNGRITRWYLAMQPFRFKVHYIPGKDNTTADYLSRCQREDQEVGECVMAKSMATL
ncbi:trace amine-associated receptor 4-like [Poecilia latipinna]|uniref:trace amine-associated receptor 4-like n=1 Tax=Poecilia latipinna TaxID=48699 RepID=UPI00072EACB7|nr:PREDICTED: trace amine-associated receptor 4-like [Poecilia latipinna]